MFCPKFISYINSVLFSPLSSRHIFSAAYCHLPLDLSEPNSFSKLTGPKLSSCFVKHPPSLSQCHWPKPMVFIHSSSPLLHVTLTTSTGHLACAFKTISRPVIFSPLSLLWILGEPPLSPLGGCSRLLHPRLCYLSNHTADDQTVTPSSAPDLGFLSH